MKILTIILNWRQPRVTLACVAAVRQMTYPTDILVIDNGSQDDSAEILATVLLPHELTLLDANVGFAAGCNAGLRHAMAQQYEYALLLNNDAFPAPDMLHRLVEEVGTDIALLIPAIYYEDDPKRIWFGGATQHPLTLEMRNRRQGEHDDGDLRTQDVEYVVGTCLLVNLAAVTAVGLLDQRYFMYYEDLDWSQRFRHAGYRLRMVADAHLYHRIALSSGGVLSPSRVYYLARSSVVFFRTYLRDGVPLLIIAWRVASAVRALARFAARGNGSLVRSYLRGVRDGWKLSSAQHERLGA